jgi:hypothetical protein
MLSVRSGYPEFFCGSRIVFLGIALGRGLPLNKNYLAVRPHLHVNHEKVPTFPISPLRAAPTAIKKLSDSWSGALPALHYYQVECLSFAVAAEEPIALRGERRAFQSRINQIEKAGRLLQRGLGFLCVSPGCSRRIALPDLLLRLPFSHRKSAGCPACSQGMEGEPWLGAGSFGVAINRFSGRAAVGSVLFGLDGAISSGALPRLRSRVGPRPQPVRL